MICASEETPVKKAKIETAEPTTPRPLTEKNLKRLQRAMMPGGLKRQNSQASGKSGGSKKSKSGESNEGSDSQSKTTATSRSDIRYLFESFQKNGLPIEDRNAAKSSLGKAILENAKKIIASDRGSAMKSAEQQDLLDTIDKYKRRSEANFIAEVWTRMILNHRSIKNLGQDASTATDAQLIQAWEKDHLDIDRDLMWRQDCIPRIDTTNDPVLARLLETLDRVKTPKPDRAYGFNQSGFSKEEQTLNNLFPEFARLTTEIYHTFFIVEFKNYKHSIDEVILQACRSGAAMINGMRKFKEKAGVLNATNAQDNGSIAFSMAMVPSTAQLFVHWAKATAPTEETAEDTPPAEEANPQVEYHMTLVNAYSLPKERDIAELRHDVNNILDWGLEFRLPYVKKLLAKVKVQDANIARLTRVVEGNEDIVA